MKVVINIVTLALAGISSSVQAHELGGGAVVSSESEVNLSSCMSSTNSTLNTHPPFCHHLILLRRSWLVLQTELSLRSCLMLSPTRTRRNSIVVDVAQEVLTEPEGLSFADGPNQGRTGTMPNVKGGKGTAVHIIIIIAATGLILHALASTSTMRRTSWMRTSNTRTSRARTSRISSRARTSRTKNFMTRTSRKTSTNSSLNSLLCFKRYALGVDLPVFYLYHVAMMCC